MRRQSRINLLLLAVVIALGLIAWYASRQASTPPPPPLTKLQPAQIRAIQISDTRGREIQLEKQQGQWRMIAPYQVAANEPRIEQLLRIAATPSHARYPLPTDRLAEFGLSPGRIRLRFNDQELIFGNTEPLQRYRYVALGGELHLISDGYYHHLLAMAEDYVSHSLLPEGAEILAIRARDWTLYRDEAGLWVLDPPVEGLSADRLNQRAMDWQYAQALDVQPAPTEETTRAIYIELQDQEKPLRFEIVQDSAQILLIRRDLGLGFRMAASIPLIQPLSADTP